jgi:2-methylcitrate dehydratase PrpD
MATIAERYAEFICGLSFADLPDEVVGRAKTSLLDLLGVMLAGSDMPFPKAARHYLAGLEGKPQATMIRTGGRRFPAAAAALANGICSHALDMDDGHRYGAVHPGTAVIPAALAAAETCDADGGRLIAGVVAGFEVTIRIARAINPSHLSRGFHTTGTVGTFGAAAAAGSVLGLSFEQMTHALGLAGLQSAGLLEVLHDGSMAKPLHPGHAGAAGIVAAELAARGVEGPRTVLEGPKGFLRAMADSVDRDRLTRGLGATWEILQTYIKLHAACRHVHPSIDCALHLRAEGVAPAQIKGVRVRTYPVAVEFCGHTVQPASVSAAKFSLPFGVAVAFCKGDAFTDTFSEAAIKDQEIQDLAAKVRVEAGEDWARAYPGIRGAELVVTLADGRDYRRKVDLPHGEPEDPAGLEEIQRKFLANACLAIPASQAEAIMDRVLHMEGTPPSELMQML